MLQLVELVGGGDVTVRGASLVMSMSRSQLQFIDESLLLIVLLGGVARWPWGASVTAGGGAEDVQLFRELDAAQTAMVVAVTGLGAGVLLVCGGRSRVLLARVICSAFQGEPRWCRE